MSNKTKHPNSWPKLALGFFITISLLTCSKSSSFGQGSGYYEIPGKSISTSSNCCCTEAVKNDKEIFYICKSGDDTSCPVNTKKYNVSSYECPSSVTVTRYAQAKN